MTIGTQGDRSSRKLERVAPSAEREATREAGERPGIARLYDQTRRVREDVEGLVSAALEARSDWESRLRDQLTERPYLGLATAAGVGYVLGAGISPTLIRTVFALGTRVAFAVMMRRLAIPLTEAIVDRTA